MGWLEFSSAVIKAVAWPLALMVTVFLFRRPLRDIMPSLHRVKAGTTGVELEWDNSIEATQHELDKERSHEPSIAPNGSSPSHESVGTGIFPMREISQLADVSPASAVADTYRRLQNHIKQTLMARGVNIDDQPSSRKIIDLAWSHSVLTLPQKNAMDRLRQMRNAAIHDVSFRVTKDQAIEYACTAQDLASTVSTQAELLSQLKP
jgi:hypothetical protein